MKIEIGEKRPENFKEYWPGQYDIFSHFEYACGIPSVLYAITTRKENGKPNVNFNGWSSFSSEGKGFYAVMPSMLHHTHTYKNILLTGEFIINFIGKDYYDACIATINDNDDDSDEIAAGGFTEEKAVTMDCPRLKEAFLSLECRFEKEVKLCDDSMTSVIIGKVIHIAVDENYAAGLDEKYGENGFMLYIHAPKNLKTGAGKPSAVSVCKITRVNEDG
ncbi:MAG TPA: flavin reductase [Oscillospiraceae bacterium]|nr:flavin reductase [Oscillospiraceae bacterium]HPF56524.1 flavin reductase [Clostridiales bacterium]HPK34606.1 flavin reductase [Oscillospiraceae bacterium]HPR74629.1 flavin reductase [Oscillospiraceae bacterium]